MALVGVLALPACGVAAPAAQPTAPAPTSPPTDVPTAQPAPTDVPAAQPAPTAPGSPAPTPEPQGDGTALQPPDALVQAAQQHLAAYLQRPAGDLALQRANREAWPDGALGCPKAGTSYPQVVTPGFRLIFTADQQRQRYEIHTGVSAARLVLCQEGVPAELAAPSGGEPAIDRSEQLGTRGQVLLSLARTALARDLAIDAAAITFVSAAAVEWNDSSLGCPKPGLSYLQVITPGYRMVFEAQGRTYEYHTDMGKRVVRCDG